MIGLISVCTWLHGKQVLKSSRGESVYWWFINLRLAAVASCFCAKKKGLSVRNGQEHFSSSWHLICSSQTSLQVPVWLRTFTPLFFFFSLISTSAAECYPPARGCNWWTANGNSLSLFSMPLSLSFSTSLSYPLSFSSLSCKAAVIPLMGCTRHSFFFFDSN